MKKTALVVAVSGIVAVLVCFCYMQLRDAQRMAEATREASKMMELRTRLAPEFESYYQKHGAYPQKLRDLSLVSFNWGSEGAMPRDLESFTYASDGQSFVLRWKGAGGYPVYLAGVRGESKYSEADPAPNTGNSL